MLEITCLTFLSKSYTQLPLERGKIRVQLSNMEMVRYHHLQGKLVGAMVECCVSTWRKEPVIFPYLYGIHFERIGRCVMTHNSDLKLPEVKSTKEVHDTLVDYLNTFFQIYLKEYFYSPPC